MLVVYSEMRKYKNTVSKIGYNSLKKAAFPINVKWHVIGRDG